MLCYGILACLKDLKGLKEQASLRMPNYWDCRVHIKK